MIDSAFAAVGVLCLLISLGIFEAQLTLMFFDKSIDVTIPMLATIGASLLAPIVARLLGARRALVATTVPLALATLIATTVRIEDVELIASGVGVVTGMWWFAILANTHTGTSHRPLRLGLPIALGVMLVLRAAGRTTPLDELSLPTSIVIDATLLLVLAAAGRSTATRVTGWSTTDRRGVLALFALPFLFALALDVGLNGAVITGASGLLSAPAAPLGSSLGLVVAGIGVAAALVGAATGLARGPIAAGAIVLGVALLWSRAGPGALLGGATLAFGLVIAAAVLDGTERRGARLPVLPMVAPGLGWIAAIVAALVYYLGVGFAPALAAIAGVVAVAAALMPGQRVSAPRAPLVALAVVAILVPSVAVATTPSPMLVAHGGGLRFMTYNIHLGYDDGDVPSTLAIADVIAAQLPDVVGLEEVTRGTVIAGGHDVLELLAGRLRMSYVFAPMLGDVEGVAILSRLPIDEVRTVRLARATTSRDLTRVALMVRTGGMWFVATHLGGNDFTTQVSSIIAAVRGLDAVIVSGDMNSLPDSPQMRLFADAGFTDLGAAAGRPTIPVSAPASRIDYLWGAGVRASDVRTIETPASDHLPVVADVVAR